MTRLILICMLIFVTSCATTQTEQTAQSSGWPRYEYYKSAGKWWWRFKARNGNCMSDSGQGFPSKAAVLSAIDTVRSDGPEPVIERDSGCRK